MNENQNVNYNEISKGVEESKEIKQETATQPKELLTIGTVKTLLNLRKEPSMDSKILTVMATGETVIPITGTDDDIWVEVQYGPHKGFCLEEHLDIKQIPKE